MKTYTWNSGTKCSVSFSTETTAFYEIHFFSIDKEKFTFHGSIVLIEPKYANKWAMKKIPQHELFWENVTSTNRDQWCSAKLPVSDIKPGYISKLRKTSLSIQRKSTLGNFS